MTLQQQKDIGIWCNGNTTDSGPVIPGSNPGSPTKKSCECNKFVAFLLFLPKSINV